VVQTTTGWCGMLEIHCSSCCSCVLDLLNCYLLVCWRFIVLIVVHVYLICYLLLTTVILFSHVESVWEMGGQHMSGAWHRWKANYLQLTGGQANVAIPSGRRRTVDSGPHQAQQRQ